MTFLVKKFFYSVGLKHNKFEDMNFRHFAVFFLQKFIIYMKNITLFSVETDKI